MTPTLAGRIQTRLLLIAYVGITWTLMVVPLLPAVPDYLTGVRSGLVALGVTATVGIAWELGYHLAQQLRWEKDWPILFGLATGVTEGLVVHRIVGSLADRAELVPRVDATAFWIHFGSTWLVLWLVANGPLRVASLRWRYRGGRFS